MAMIMKPGFTLRAAEMVAVMFREWDASTELDAFARGRFPDADPDDITFAVALFDTIDSAAEANDLVEQLKSIRPQ